MYWKKLLKKNFGYDNFIYPQYKIVKDTVKNYDQLVVLPTGSGKSICYQLPAIAGEGFSIVISPLKSLIKDQIDNLKKKNIRVFSFYGDTKQDEKDLLNKEVIEYSGKTHIIYTTPETIEKNLDFRQLLDTLDFTNRLNRFIIDEAHCISQWGNNFRPSYRALEKIRDVWPCIPIMALTATAPDAVRKDIVKLLRFRKYKQYTKSYFRKNLKLTIKEKNTSKKKHNKNILDLILEKEFLNTCGIIYCQTRKKCENLEEYLNTYGLQTKAYHAGKTKKYREETSEQWQSNNINIIIATIAFGMGIDKPDVRFIVHNDMPTSMESYYQEIGRAGRDSLDSECILYYSDTDRENAKKLINYSYRQNWERSKTPADRKNHQRNLKHTQELVDKFSAFCDDHTNCRHQIISKYLGEPDLPKCIHSCDNCKNNGFIPQINVTQISIDIVNIIYKLGDSAYKTNMTDIFKKQYAYKYKSRFRTQKRTLEMFNKCLTYLRINKFIRERIVKLQGSHNSMITYKLFNKSKELLKKENSIDIFI